MTTAAEHMPEQLSRSLEDYLEAIYQICRQKQVARAKDIADRLSVQRPSVTGALRALAERNLINYAPYEFVTLTEAGEELAANIAQRHSTLKRFLTDILAIEPEQADVEACSLEHALSGPVLEKLLDFLTFVDDCPRAGQSWIDGFHFYANSHGHREKCSECLQRCVSEFSE